MVASIAVSTVLLFARPIQAQPAQFPVQGFLTDTSDAPIDGSNDITFRIYASESEVTPVFEETQTLTVDAGFFSAMMGAVSALALGTIRDASQPVLGIVIGSGEERSPRLPLGLVGYAAVAN